MVENLLKLNFLTSFWIIYFNFYKQIGLAHRLLAASAAVELTQPHITVTGTEKRVWHLSFKYRVVLTGI